MLAEDRRPLESVWDVGSPRPPPAGPARRGLRAASPGARLLGTASHTATSGRSRTAEAGALARLAFRWCPGAVSPGGWAQQEPRSECHRLLTPARPCCGEGYTVSRDGDHLVCSRVPGPRGHWLRGWPPTGRAVQICREVDSTGPAGGGGGLPPSQTLSRGCRSVVSVPVDSASVSRLTKERRGRQRAWGCRPPPRRQMSWSLAAPPEALGAGSQDGHKRAPETRGLRGRLRNGDLGLRAARGRGLR